MNSQTGNDEIERTDRPLRILAVSQHYWPEPFAIPDVCESLVAIGHSVTVLTGVPNYPDGDVYPGYENGAQAEQEHNGVRIVRAPIIPRGRSTWQRVLNYYSFSTSATRVARGMDPGFDVVLSFQTSPVMMSRPALAYAQRHGAPVLLWCQDLWPESLAAGNIGQGSRVYKHYARVSEKIYSSADTLAVSSRAYGEYFRDVLGMRNVQPVYLPQYAEHVFEEEAPVRADYDPEKVNLTFAGNVGSSLSLDTFLEAARLLEDDGRFALHVVGSGSELEALKRRKSEAGVRCLVFHGRHPIEDMPAFYASSDAMVATFKNNSILRYALPRKVVSYMAAGRPILGTFTGEVKRIIEEAGCGICCAAEDPSELARACREFADMAPAQREAMGESGRRYYEEHFSKERFFAVLENELQKLKGTKHGG